MLVLAALQSGPSYGYAVIESLRERSGGLFELPEGTVYPALHRLEAQGLLASRWSAGTARRRRVYRITAAGRAALGQQVRDWAAFSRAIVAVVGARA